MLEKRDEWYSMTSKPEIDTWAAGASVSREKTLEHLFLGELSRCMLLQTGRGPEILRAEHDSYGYDVVVGAGGVDRHIQLKAGRKDGKRANVDIHVALAAKASGCVVWMMVDPKTYELGPFYWFGGPPGRPLPPLGDRSVRHSKADSTGAKAVRPDLRRLPKGSFTRLETIGDLIHALFGASHDRLLLAHLRSRPFEPTERQPWLAAVRVGEYQVAPPQLSWEDSIYLANLIDGYALAREAGLGDPHAYQAERLARATETGRWEGDALELWASLFLEHRRERFGVPYEGEQLRLMETLVATLLNRMRSS